MLDKTVTGSLSNSTKCAIFSFNLKSSKLNIYTECSLGVVNNMITF